jgi:hypothetical protein
MDLQIFMTSCICHPFRFQKWVDRTIGDEKKHSIGGFKCIMRGRILPSLAAGEWKEVLRKISIRRSGRVLAHTVELEDEERAEVVDDFSLMKGRTSLMCEEKISAGYEALPPGLAVLVHPDERIARQHCPRIIDMLEHLMTQKTWDQVHPLIAYVHAKISELRKFALGEILRKDLNANMLRKLRRLALAQVNESPIEGRHGVANSRLRKRRKRELYLQFCFRQSCAIPNSTVYYRMTVTQRSRCKHAPNNKTEHMLVPTKVHEGNLFDESQLFGFANELLGEGAPGAPFRTRVTILSLGASRVSPGV